MVSANKIIRELCIDNAATNGYILPCTALNTLPAAGISIQGCECVCMLACVSLNMHMYAYNHQSECVQMCT